MKTRAVLHYRGHYVTKGEAGRFLVRHGSIENRPWAWVNSVKKARQFIGQRES